MVREVLVDVFRGYLLLHMKRFMRIFFYTLYRLRHAQQPYRVKINRKKICCD